MCVTESEERESVLLRKQPIQLVVGVRTLERETECRSERGCAKGREREGTHFDKMSEAIYHDLTKDPRDKVREREEEGVRTEGKEGEEAGVKHYSGKETSTE